MKENTLKKISIIIKLLFGIALIVKVDSVPEITIIMIGIIFILSSIFAALSLYTESLPDDDE